MMQDNYHIYSNRVFIDGDLQPASLSIANGKISATHLGVQLNDVVNYEDSVIMPGVIDAHVHTLSPTNESPASVRLTLPLMGPNIAPKSPTSLEKVKDYNPAILCRFCHRHKERAVEIITACESLWNVCLCTC